MKYSFDLMFAMCCCNIHTSNIYQASGYVGVFWLFVIYESSESYEYLEPKGKNTITLVVGLSKFGCLL